jgi:hypothetical protein
MRISCLLLSDRPRQDSEGKSTIHEVSTSDSAVKGHSSASDLKSETSTSEGKEHYRIPVDIRTFPKAGVCKRSRKRKSRVSAILADTPVKAALESEVKPHRKPAERMGYSER